MVIDHMRPATAVRERLLGTPLTGPSIFGGQAWAILEDTASIAQNRLAVNLQLELVRQAHALGPVGKPLTGQPSKEQKKHKGKAKARPVATSASAGVSEPPPAKKPRKVVEAPTLPNVAPDRPRGGKGKGKGKGKASKGGQKGPKRT
jgi:hypothetical protein